VLFCYLCTFYVIIRNTSDYDEGSSLKAFMHRLEKGGKPKENAMWQAQLEKQILRGQELARIIEPEEDQEEKADALVKQENRRIKDLPDHCSGKPGFKEIIIKGERHTGTNLMRSILQHNAKEGITVAQESLDIGWKHGFLPPQGWGRPLAADDLLLVVTRDVFTWLPKIFRESYDEIMKKKSRKGFSNFIRTEYGAMCQPLQNKSHPHLSNYQKKFCSARREHHWWDVFQNYDNYDKVVGETAENVIQIRTQKYKQWLSENPAPEAFHGSKEQFLQNRIHVRLESYTIDNDGLTNSAKDPQERVIGRQLIDHCVHLYDDFREVAGYTKWQGFVQPNKRKLGVKNMPLAVREEMADKEEMKNSKSFDTEKEKQMVLKRYSKEDLRFVLSQLDMEFERKLGYNYDYIYEMLEKDDSVFESARRKSRHREKPMKGKSRHVEKPTEGKNLN